MMSQARSTVCQLLFSLELGGAELLAARIARRLRDNYRFVFICLESMGCLGEGLRDDGFPVHVLDKQSGVDWRVIRRLKRLLRREGLDLIHAHQYGAFFYAAMARFPFRHPPILLTDHGRDFPDRALRSHILANRVLLAERDRLVGVGANVRVAMIDNEGFPADRVGVVYNGINTDLFAGVNEHRALMRRELGIDPGDFVILQAARLQPIKDHATAIRAMARVVRSLGEVRLLIAGEGGLASEIDSLINQLGLGDHVRLLGRRTDIDRLLGAADAALLSSVSEGIPLSLIEAMAASLPVVATRVGGIPDVVEEGRSGFLVPAGDDEAMAERILRLARNSALSQQLGEAGCARAAALFSEERMVAEYDQMYREMTRKAPGRRERTARLKPQRDIEATLKFAEPQPAEGRHG